MKLPLSFLKDLHCGNFKTNVFLFLLVFILCIRNSPASENIITDCGLPKCKVKCSCQHETYMGCEAIERTLNFFKNHGHEIKTLIDIEFIKNPIINGEKDQGCKSTTEQFQCQYNKKTKCIKISSWIHHSNWNKMAFGAYPLDIEYFTSLVTHEVAHCLFDSILKSREETTSHSFHEFIAYVTQIETMKEPQKSKVLFLWPNEELPSVFAINSFIWMADPNKFSVLSYRFFKAHPEVVQEILNGKIQSSEMRFILDY